MNRMMSGRDGDGNGEVDHEFATPLNVLDAVYHTAHRYPGGVATLALRMGLKASTLNHKVSLTCATHHLSVDEAVLMQAVSGDFAVLNSMAASLGHVVLPVDPSGAGKPMADLARMVCEFGELLTSVTESTADGTVTTNEVRACQQHALDAIGAIYAVMSNVRSMLPERAE